MSEEQQLPICSVPGCEKPVRSYIRKKPIERLIVNTRCVDHYHDRSPEAMERKRQISMLKDKSCRVCGTKENLRTNNFGKLSICVECFGKEQSIRSTEIFNRPEVKKKLSEQSKRLFESKKEKLQQGFQEKHQKIMQEDPEFYARRNKAWMDQMTPEERQTWIDKTRDARIAGGTYVITEEMKRKMRATKRNKTKAEKDAIVEKFRDSMAKKSPEELEARLRKMHDYGRIHGRSVSKEEMKCYEFLKSHYPDIEHGKIHEGHLFDFYIPSKKIFIEFSGTYWHGLLLSWREMLDLRRSERGKAILNTMRRDRIKDEIAPNLVRISDLQFAQNPAMLLEMIKRLY